MHLATHSREYRGGCGGSVSWPCDYLRLTGHSVDRLRQTGRAEEGVLKEILSQWFGLHTSFPGNTRLENDLVGPMGWQNSLAS